MLAGGVGGLGGGCRTWLIHNTVHIPYPLDKTPRLLKVSAR